MVKGILADHNVRGQVDYLAALLRSDLWSPFWNDLALAIMHFEQVGLQSTARDREVWQRCQDEQLVLITANRNQSGPDSLEATIRSLNTPVSLPVFTIADLNRLSVSRAYADEIVESLLEFLRRIEDLRGTGRLWLP